MYVLTHNNQVLLGPINWNSRMFNSVILDDTEIVTNVQPSDVQNVPLDLGDGLMIRKATETRDALNPKIQMHNGPFWTFTDTEGIANYVAVDKPIDLAKQELLTKLAYVRWLYEELGTTLTLQGQTVTVDTVRSTRSVFVEQYLLLPPDASSPWKFPEGWFTVTKAELGTCVQAGVDHVKSAFIWEGVQVARINAATQLSELLTIEVAEVDKATVDATVAYVVSLQAGG
jgi:hypothetical protein